MIDRIIKKCLKCCVTQDLPVFPDDLSHYQQSNNEPQSDFSAMSKTDQNAYLRYIFNENRLNEFKNENMVFHLFCHLIEKGTANLLNFIQIALDMEPSEKWNCRIIQALQQSEQSDPNLIQQLCVLSNNFRQISQLIDREIDSSSESQSTDQSDSEERNLPNRLEPNPLVLKAQKLLNDEGFDIPLYGIFDAQTENVIRQYQTKKNIPVDGLVTQNLIDVLEGKEKKPRNPQIGGVNLNTKVKLISQIRGIRLNPKSHHGLSFLVDSNQSANFSGVDLEDLALCLSVYSDPTIKYKTISFSLDPWEENNPEGEFQKKVLYPDVLDHKKVLAGTKLSELMFECDYLMKQMSLGVEEDCKTPFKYPQELIDHGMKPKHRILHDIQQASSKKNELKVQPKHNWARLWLVCKEIEGITDTTAKGGIILSNNVKVEVQARQMEQDETGKLVDKKDQDQSDDCYIFAKIFTDLYPLIEKHYPCFEKIKKLYRASALAKWISDQEIPIDMNQLKELCKGQFLDKYEDRVNKIQKEVEIDIGTEEHKIPVDVRKLIIDSLKEQKIEITEEKINEYKSHLVNKVNNGSEEFFETKLIRKVKTWQVQGGVDMNCNIIPPQVSIKKSVSLKTEIKKSDSQQKMVKKSISPIVRVLAALGDVRMNANYSFDKNDKESEWNVDCSSSVSTSSSNGSNRYGHMREVEFPFALSQNCTKCSKILSLKEMKNPNDGKYFCRVHHPKNCYYCHKIIKGRYYHVKGSKELYDSESYAGKDVLMHPECCQIFQNKCRDKANLNNQNQSIIESNTNYLEQFRTIIPTIKTLSELQRTNSGTFTCKMCKKNNRNITFVCCSLCGLTNFEQAKVCLNEMVDRNQEYL